jgi:hypothetical protein
MFKNILNKVYRKFSNGNDLIPDRIAKYSNLIWTNLNTIIDNLYNPDQKDLLSPVLENKIECQIQNSNYEFFNKLNENLNKIQFEFSKIMKENFKINENYNSVKNNLEFTKQISEALSVDKEVQVENNNLSPKLNLYSNEDDIQKILSIITDNVFAVDLLLKKLNEISKPPDNSSKFLYYL